MRNHVAFGALTLTAFLLANSAAIAQRSPEGKAAEAVIDATKEAARRTWWDVNIKATELAKPLVPGETPKTISGSVKGNEHIQSGQIGYLAGCYMARAIFDVKVCAEIEMLAEQRANELRNSPMGRAWAKAREEARQRRIRYEAANTSSIGTEAAASACAAALGTSLEAGRAKEAARQKEALRQVAVLDGAATPSSRSSPPEMISRPATGETCSKLEETKDAVRDLLAKAKSQAAGRLGLTDSGRLSSLANEAITSAQSAGASASAAGTATMQAVNDSMAAQTQALAQARAQKEAQAVRANDTSRESTYVPYKHDKICIRSMEVCPD